MPALALVLFAALSLNLLLHFALGIKELILRERFPPILLYYPWIILFVSTILLWVFFARILFFTGGIFDLFLVFPLSVLCSMALEKLLFRVLLAVKEYPLLKGLSIKDIPLVENPAENKGVFSVGSTFNGMAGAALFLTLHFALSFADAVLLALAFSAGGLLAFLLVKEIQKRSFLETIPYSLRGTPLLLITMGLLSLVFSAASVLFLKIFL